MPDSLTPPERHHLVTVALEDYYHVEAFNRLIQHGQWYRFEKRLERSTRRTLDLLDEYGVRATFFVLGWIGRAACRSWCARWPDRGHEVASKGYYHRSISQMTPEEFRDDLARSREVLERASGQRGARLPRGGRVVPAVETSGCSTCCARQGYEYDSSIAPMLLALGAPSLAALRAHALVRRAGALGAPDLEPGAASGCACRSAATSCGSSRRRSRGAPSMRWHRGTARRSCCTSTPGRSTRTSRRSARPPRSSSVRQYRNLDRMAARLSALFSATASPASPTPRPRAPDRAARPPTPAPGAPALAPLGRAQRRARRHGRGPGPDAGDRSWCPASTRRTAWPTCATRCSRWRSGWATGTTSGSSSWTTAAPTTPSPGCSGRSAAAATARSCGTR